MNILGLAQIAKSIKQAFVNLWIISFKRAWNPREHCVAWWCYCCGYLKHAWGHAR